MANCMELVDVLNASVSGGGGNDSLVPEADIFDFTDDLSVGNEAIDSDHRAFFELARLVHDSGAGSERDLVIQTALLMLQEYVDGHFLREEEAMKAVRYPRFAEHRHRHEIFRGRLHGIADSYLSGTLSVADDLPTLVARWLRGHIASDDLQYKAWISHARVDPRPLVFLSMDAEKRRVRGK